MLEYLTFDNEQKSTTEVDGNVLGVTKGKVRGSPKSVGFILW